MFRVRVFVSRQFSCLFAWLRGVDHKPEAMVQYAKCEGPLPLSLQDGLNSVKVESTS